MKTILRLIPAPRAHPIQPKDQDMAFRNFSSTFVTATAIVALAAPMTAMAQPTPSFWDVANLVPGNPVTASHPWEVLEATGTTCGTPGAALTTNWTSAGGAWVGKGTSASLNLPLVFRAVSSTTSAGQGITMSAGSVAMHPAPAKCAVIRFKAPADGIYKIAGEFFAPVASQTNHPNFVNTRVLDKGTQIAAGVVDKPGAIQSWNWPNAYQFQLHAGQTIDFAVDGGSNGIGSDTVQLVGRVTWTAPLDFKASKFDFEGAQACAIEQGSDKLHCWGVNNWNQLGTTTSPSANKAVVAQRVENYITANSTGAAKNLQVGANNVCILTASGKVLCWGANTVLQSGLASGSHITTANSGPHAVRDITAQLPANPKARIDGFTGCFVNPASKVQCWGGNIINTNAFGGLLGWKNGTVFTPNYLPLQDVPNISGASQVAPGGTMTCAIVSATARVNCWGDTPWGPSMLGGGPSPTLLPHPDGVDQTYVLTSPSNPLLQVQKIRVAGGRACALKAGGSLWCWGMNHTYGTLLGAPMITSTPPTPNPPGIVSFATGLPAPFNSGVSDFALSSDGLCAVKTGQVYCLGRNVAGQLGKPMSNSSGEWRTPFAMYSGQLNVVVDVLPIAGFTSVSKIEGGDRAFCALKVSGEIWCWGANIDGQLGGGLPTGPSSMSASPVRVIK